MKASRKRQPPTRPPLIPTRAIRPRSAHQPPQATPRARVKRTLGPGTKMMAIEAAINAANCPPLIIRLSLETRDDSVVAWVSGIRS